MADALRGMLKRLTEFFQKVEKKKLILFIALAAVVVAAGIIGAILLNQVHYTVLYSGLEASEAGTIKTVLDGKGVTSKVQGTSTILVPEDQADTLRIQLAAEGYPNSGLNYNIFSNSTSIGSTDLERRTYYQYQLQENMRTTIKHMDKVQDCVVIVNLAQDSSFVLSDNKSVATVAVQLSIKNGQTLTTAEAKTIQEFVLKCVPNLKAENVSIVDSKMNYYNVSGDAASNATYSATQQQLTEQMKDVLTKQALRVLEPAMGTGNVAVAVNLSLNFDKQTVNKVEFAPPIDGESSGLVRSMQENSSGSTTTSGANGAAGTNNNGTGTPAYVAVSPSPSGTTTGNFAKTYNYELNEVQTQIEKAQGTIQNLSVAVVVNSSVKGIDSYVANLKNLVAQSIGVKPDYISVELIPFATDSAVNDNFAKNQETIQKLAQNKLITTVVTIVAVLALIIIVLKLFVKKPARKTAVEQTLEAGRLQGAAPGQAGLSGADFLGSVEPDAFGLDDLLSRKTSEEEAIDELMDRYPETVAQILRTWLSEDN